MGIAQYTRSLLPNGGVEIKPRVEAAGCWWETGPRSPMPDPAMLHRNAVDLSAFDADAADLLTTARNLCESLRVSVQAESWRAVVGPAMSAVSFLPAADARVADLRRLAKESPSKFRRTDIRFIEVDEDGDCRMEFPHKSPASLSFGNLLADPTVQAKAAKMELPWICGQQSDGSPLIVDLSDDRAAHVLIGGVPGSGKSIGLAGLISSLVSFRGPSHTRLILIDIKKTELSAWSGIRHLIGSPVLDPGAAVRSLTWLIGEMRFRYELLLKFGRKDIRAFNTGPKPHRMPRIAVVVDELGNLILSDEGKEIERLLTQIAQEGRAAGITLICATQRPASVSVPTWLRENLPARVALRTATALDSRMILTRKGAELLAGRGEFIANFPGQADFVRGQICWTPESDVEKLAAYWRTA